GHRRPAHRPRASQVGEPLAGPGAGRGRHEARAPRRPARRHADRQSARPRVTTYRERAVILRKLDYGEADRIYTLLTAEHGKVPAIAKGVRRSAAKLAAALELFAHVDVQLAHGRGQLDVLTQAVRLPGARLAADPDRTAHASLIAELADRVSEDRHPIDGLYELTMLALDDLARDEDPRR